MQRRFFQDGGGGGGGAASVDELNYQVLLLECCGADGSGNESSELLIFTVIEPSDLSESFTSTWGDSPSHNRFELPSNGQRLRARR